MRVAVRGIPILLICLLAPSAPIDAGDAPPSPAVQLRTLMKEYGEMSRGFRQATTDEERKAAVESLDRVAPRFVELAERYPQDPVAVDASVELVRAINAVDSLVQTSWETNRGSFPTARKDDTAARAVAVLLQRHLRSDKLGLVCERMAYGIRKEFETFLRAVAKENPHRDVRGLAGLSLAEILKGRVQKLDLIRDRTELVPLYEELFGKSYFEELRRQGRRSIAGEVEALFERAITEYGDVKLPYGGTVGERAKEELLEIRDLAARSQAPDTEGEDQDGRRFKLCDYRGKVVLLDFWQEL